jgi:hypothetical protein
MKSLFNTLGFSLLCLVVANGNARVSPLDDYPMFQIVGSGELTWWGIPVYQATLYAPNGQYGPNQPHALEIVYHIAISREQLAKTTLKEIEKMHGRPFENREGVREQFEMVFSDVSMATY